jgi:citronellol/citronellal dehydrogenase
MEMKDKVVVITGSAGGIGQVMALAIAQKGAKVVVADRRDQPFAKLPGTILETAQEIEKGGGQAFPVRVDLRREEEIIALKDAVLEHFGTVDVVINNAGIQYMAPIWEMPIERWDQVMSVNMSGTFLMCKHFLPTMIAKRSGTILNISSTAGRSGLGSPMRSAYGVSKAAIDYFTLGLAQEVKEYNIAVNCLAPSGSVDTSANRLVLTDEDLWKSWEPTEHYVRAAVWLAKQEFPYTGNLVFSRQLILEKDLCNSWCCQTLRSMGGDGLRLAGAQ